MIDTAKNQLSLHSEKQFLYILFLSIRVKTQNNKLQSHKLIKK